MPFQRQDDSDLLEEPTRAHQPVGQTRPTTRTDGATTRRLEAPTVVVDAAKKSGDVQTRIVRPRGKGASAKEGAEEQGDPMLDPPVGWLVVVRGPGKGRVLLLGNGMNAIGRGAQARIRIDFGDDSIARTNHARVVYEPRARHYLLSHGDGSNLTYLNQEVVMTPVELKSGGMIQMGETTLRFQGFCSEEFDWSDVDD